MKSLQYTCGEPNGPVPGQTTFTSEDLKMIFIRDIIVNNANENQLEPTPDFSHNYIMGKLGRGTNQWTLGDKLTVNPY